MSKQVAEPPDEIAPKSGGVELNDPPGEYRRRLEARRAEAARLAEEDRRLANGRPLLFVLGLLLAGFALTGRISGWWVVAPIVVFLVLVFVHDRAIRRRERAERGVSFYERGLARIEDRWAGTGTAGERFQDADHPYSGDLDLFGRGSLFELLCTARTRSGEETLARWLLAPAPLAEARRRQEAVADLRDRLDLREELFLIGEEVRGGVHVEALTAWGAAPVRLSGTGPRVGAAVLGAAVIAALVYWIGSGNPLPLVGAAVLAQLYQLPWSRGVGEVVHAVEQPGRELGLFAALLERLERERFDAPLLQELRASLDTEGLPPSRALAGIQSRIGYLEAMRNGIFAILGYLTLWPMQMAFAIEAWRAEHGPALGRWVTAAAEIEALGALAGYAYEHPDDPFPELVTGPPHFEAEAVAHPLLPTATAVRNSVTLGSDPRLLLVSGSNMSGKSTLLRTVGVNTVLALAGAPVRARRLRLTPLQVGASLRTQDSLQAGASRFYAEITRIKQVVELAGGDPPLLFLLDEILHGTNSHDRRIGAEGIVRALVARGAIGLVTTHDLALARIGDDATLQARNVHFEDHLEDGKMVFDYQLRPGVVQKSNALELMRAVGLEV